MKTPLQPLAPDQKRALAKEITNSHTGEGVWFQGLAILWLHLCLVQGVRPAETRDRDSSAFRKVERDWTPAAAKLTAVPAGALASKWARDAATHATQIYARALGDRAEGIAPATPLVF